MKGIMILSFHKKPGAFVDREFPKGITKQLGIDDIDQNKVYSLHRMRNTKPNYLFIKAKGVQIASFFSGFDTRQFIGRPNQCVSIILDNHENPTKWEDQLRRLTHDLLPTLADVRGEDIVMSGLDKDSKYAPFDQLLEQKFIELQEGKIEPLVEGEGEHLEGKGAVVETIQGVNLGGNKPKMMMALSISKDDIAAATAFAQNMNGSELQTPASAVEELDPISQATKQMEEMEKDGLRNEIRKMHSLIKEKDDRIRALESQVREASCGGEGSTGEISKIKGEYEALLASKEEELDMWRMKAATLNENDFINQDTIRKMTEMTMMMTDEAQNQSKMIVELRQKIKSLEANQGAPAASELSESEVETMRSHLAEVEEQLKKTLSDFQEKTEQTKKMFMANKANEEKIDVLKAENEELKKAAESKPAEESNFEEKYLKVKDELIQAKTVLHEKSEQLEMAKTQLQQAQDAIANYACTSHETKGADVPPVNDTLAQIEVLELKDQIRGLQDQLNAAQNSDGGGGESIRLLEGKITDLEHQLEENRKELVNAKKTIKVQRREVENLQKLLGFDTTSSAE